MPARGWWARLAAVLTVGLVGNWFVAAGIVALLLLRPFDFMAAFLLANGYATFVHYEGGKLTEQFAVLALACVFMLVCYLINKRRQIFDVPWSGLTQCVLLYGGLAMVNFLRGVASGHPWRIATTELIAALGLLTTILVANAFEPKRDLRFAFIGLVLTGFGSAALGFYVFSVIHVRTGGFYFIPVPGIAGLFLVNLALRSTTLRATAAFLLVSLPLFLHQFLSFRRGVWVGLIMALVATILIYAGRGPGVGARWRRTGQIFGSFLGLAVCGALAMAILYGQMDILEQAGGRFASIGGTETKTEHWSNLDRFAEAATVLGHIRESPWIGHGLGYVYLNTEPLTRVTSLQWQADGNYQLIWLKSGLLGLTLFIVLLVTAFRLTAREARRRDDLWESAWCATAAGATVCMGVFAMFDWPFAQAYTTFMLGLLWGGVVAMTRPDKLRIRWSVPS